MEQMVMDRLADSSTARRSQKEKEIAVLESNEPKPGSALALDAARSAKTEQPTKRRADALVHRMLSAPEAADCTSESASVRGRR